MPADKQFLTPDELVERWAGALKKGTLKNRRSQGLGPPFTKRGAKVLYPLAMLKKWERENNHLVPANDNQTDDNKP